MVGCGPTFFEISGVQPQKNNAQGDPPGTHAWGRGSTPRVGEPRVPHEKSSDPTPHPRAGTTPSPCVGTPLPTRVHPSHLPVSPKKVLVSAGVTLARSAPVSPGREGGEGKTPADGTRTGPLQRNEYRRTGPGRDLRRFSQGGSAPLKVNVVHLAPLRATLYEPPLRSALTWASVSALLHRPTSSMAPAS